MRCGSIRNESLTIKKNELLRAMKFTPALQTATLIKRYKRFLADLKLSMARVYHSLR